MTLSLEQKRRSTSSQISFNAASVTEVDTNSLPATPQTHKFATEANPSSGTNDKRLTDRKCNNMAEPRLPPDSVQGWPQLAGLMAKTPDFAAFPRFRELNVKSLLYYQAQLTLIQKKLFDMEYRDVVDGRMWHERADRLVESDSEQFKLVKDMRVTLKEYNDALLQFSQICALPNPEPFNMNTLCEWLRNKKGADRKVRGSNNLENAWGDTYETNPEKDRSGLWIRAVKLMWHLFWGMPEPKEDLDLAVTTPERKVDGLTHWIAADFTPFKNALWRHWQDKWKWGKSDPESKMEVVAGPDRLRKKETLASWSQRGALRITSTISTVVACLLPVIAISILSQLHGIGKLLGCLAGFAGLFSLILIFLTQGTSTRTEIFAATAAFSAVMVVFISQPPPPVVTVVPGSYMPSISPSPTPTLL